MNWVTALSHAYGAAFDNPDLIVVALSGDGEAETGPQATAWHSNKFINPIRDGAVLPILHLNGYKINNPSHACLASAMRKLADLFKGYGYKPYFVEGSDPETMHQAIAATLDRIASPKSSKFKPKPAAPAIAKRARFPMIVLRTPKGWTGPKGN